MMRETPKAVKAKPIRAWCVRNGRGILTSGLGRTRIAAWRALLGVTGVLPYKRRYWRSRGYRVVRVEIREVK